MAIVPLEGRIRPGTGKGPARQARRDGLIPGVMYGHGETPVSLVVPKREFELAMKTVKGSNVIVGLKLDGAAERTAIIREVQRDPISYDILHLDFHQISLTERVTIEVAVHLIGIPDGVKNGGGVLEHIARTVEIECLATQIPTSFEADVTALGIGDSVHVRDLVIPDAIVLSDPDTTIATVVPPTKAVEVTPVEGAAAEPELIAKPKPDEAPAAKG